MFKITNKKRNLTLPKGYSLETVQVGFLVTNNENEKLGLTTIGDSVIPGASFGPTCEKNAYGYNYIDKSKPKEYRYVCTNWIQPFGNEYASPVACDMYRKCYPKIEVPSFDVELSLFENDKGQKFIVAILDSKEKRDHLLEVVNMFIEIFGECYLFDNEISISDTKRRRCNWEILPKGTKPSAHLIKRLKSEGKDTDTFEVARLELLERYSANEIVEGTQGFSGYYAFVFDKCCVLESAYYGNATYIIPKEDWEILSQKTKQELFDEKKVLAKINHTQKWNDNIKQQMCKIEGKSIYWGF